MKGLAVLLLIIITFICCKTFETIETLDLEKHWTYKIEITKPGTGSEGKLGHLYYRGKEIKSYFNSIIINDIEYDYFIRKDIQDFGGHIEDKEHISDISYSGLKIENDDIILGWYFADSSEKRQDTPRNWVWIKRENLKAFINPDKIDSFINNYELMPIIKGIEKLVNVRFEFTKTF